MRRQLNQCLHPLRCWMASHASRRSSMPTAQALEQASQLDARTSWPTHRIRSFLLMQRPGSR